MADTPKPTPPENKAAKNPTPKPFARMRQGLAGLLTTTILLTAAPTKAFDPVAEKAHDAVTTTAQQTGPEQIPPVAAQTPQPDDADLTVPCSYAIGEVGRLGPRFVDLDETLAACKDEIHDTGTSAKNNDGSTEIGRAFFKENLDTLPAFMDEVRANKGAFNGRTVAFVEGVDYLKTLPNETEKMAKINGFVNTMFPYNQDQISNKTMLSDAWRGSLAKHLKLGSVVCTGSADLKYLMAAASGVDTKKLDLVTLNENEDPLSKDAVGNKPLDYKVTDKVDGLHTVLRYTESDAPNANQYILNNQSYEAPPQVSQNPGGTRAAEQNKELYTTFSNNAVMDHAGHFFGKDSLQQRQLIAEATPEGTKPNMDVVSTVEKGGQVLSVYDLKKAYQVAGGDRFDQQAAQGNKFDPMTLESATGQSPPRSALETGEWFKDPAFKKFAQDAYLYRGTEHPETAPEPPPSAPSCDKPTLDTTFRKPATTPQHLAL